MDEAHECEYDVHSFIWFFMLEADYVWMRPMNVHTVFIHSF